MDDGALTYNFCEDNSPMENVPLVEPCCACDEAKYEVSFCIAAFQYLNKDDLVAKLNMLIQKVRKIRKSWMNIWTKLILELMLSGHKKQ